MSQNLQQPSHSPYIEAVQDFRQRKDAHFAAGKGPVDAATFRGLSYFAPDPTWVFRLPLTLLPQDASAETVLETNTGQQRVMARYGEISVPMGNSQLGNSNSQHTFSVFVPLGEDQPQRVFIPFRDATAGKQTYGAGRYIDAPVFTDPDSQSDSQSDSQEMMVDLDFNMAYQPYCAYSEGWTCPLPPPENWVNTAIAVGEKLPSN